MTQCSPLATTTDENFRIDDPLDSDATYIYGKSSCVEINDPIDITKPLDDKYFIDFGKTIDHSRCIITYLWLRNQQDPIENGLYVKRDDINNIRRPKDLDNGHSFFNRYFNAGEDQYVFINREDESTVGVHAPRFRRYIGIITIHTMVRAIMHRLDKLEDKIEELWYQPGGIGETEARTHFESSRLKRKRQDEDDLSESSNKIARLDEVDSLVSC
jgi:hypothetical protein